VLGNFHQLDRGAAHNTIEEWSKQYGNCFRVALGRREMLVVTEPAIISGILRDRPDGKDVEERLSFTMGPSKLLVTVAPQPS
jgi:hypothetical protein